MATPKPSDNDYVRRIMAENESGTRKLQVVRLPCGDSVEVEKAEDQWLFCPDHRKKFYLTWSPIEGHTKIAENVPDFVRKYH